MVFKILCYSLAIGCCLGSFNKSFCQVIKYETKIIVNESGKKTTEKSILVQINNKEENWMSHIELRHDPKQNFSFNYASIIDVKGNTVKKIKKKDLITRNDLSHQAFYQDDLITEFDLYWNQYPYQVKYSYTIVEEEYLFTTWWTPILDSSIPTLEGLLEVNLPLDYKVKISSSENISHKESIRDNRKVHTWRSAITQLPENEIYSLPNRSRLPSVQVVPSKFKYGKPGYMDSWSSFGSWLGALNQGTDQLPFSEKLIIDKLIGGIEDKCEIIKTIYYYLQDRTKYVNVAIDVGGLQSYPASYVCENKYGDCKALTTYMKAMLGSIGIESFYTIINAGENKAEIDLNFPSQQFNHVILMVPLKNDTVWLENTSNSLPFNYLGTFTQNRYALSVNGEKSLILKTPALLRADVLLEREYDFQISKNNEAQIAINLTLRGAEFENFRYFLKENNEKRQNNAVLEHIGINGFEVRNWNVSDFHRDSCFVRLNVSGILPSAVREIGSLEVINPLKIDLPEFEKPSKRELDILFPYPINRSDKSAYRLGEKQIQIPDDIKIQHEFGQYHASFKEEDNNLIVKENLTLVANQIPIAKYAEFYNFISSIVNYKKKTAIVIQ